MDKVQYSTELDSTNYTSDTLKTRREKVGLTNALETENSCVRVTFGNKNTSKCESLSETKLLPSVFC
jgi:hypothetical protein